MSKGYVYILSNPDHDSVKIGLTTGDVYERAKALNSTGVRKPFDVEYFREVNNCQLVEKSLHRKFSSKRHKGTEFFDIPLSKAIAALVKYDCIGEEFCRLDTEAKKIPELKAKYEAERKIEEAEILADEKEHRKYLKGKEEELKRLEAALLAWAKCKIISDKKRDAIYERYPITLLDIIFNHNGRKRKTAELNEIYGNDFKLKPMYSDGGTYIVTQEQEKIAMKKAFEELRE